MRVEVELDPPEGIEMSPLRLSSSRHCYQEVDFADEVEELPKGPPPTPEKSIPFPSFFTRSPSKHEPGANEVVVLLIR
jgi:hypothetical protein